MKVRTLIFVLLFVPHYLGATSLTEEGRVNMVNVEKKYIPLSQEELLEPLRKKEVLAYATLVNDYFMKKYPDVGAYSNVGNRKRDSKIWTRGVYYEGLLAMYVQSPKPEWLKYAVDWANFHHWKIGEGKAARHADYQCCGQAYLDLYMLDTTKVYRKVHVKEMIDEMLATDKIDDWHWVDALQMLCLYLRNLERLKKTPVILIGCMKCICILGINREEKNVVEVSLYLMNKMAYGIGIIVMILRIQI